jgi:CRISPR-associated protein Cst1
MYVTADISQWSPIEWKEMGVHMLSHTDHLLNYTGHPFFDVGVAAITAFSKKQDPKDVTSEDLREVASYIETNYVRPPLRGHLTMAFTSNAWFIQDAYNPNRPGLKPQEQSERRAIRAEWSSRHVLQWQVDTPTSATELCTFTGQPIISTNLSGKLPNGRAGRAQLPLLQGDDAINFFTDGYSGLPISGLALLALQFFPIGCIKSGIGLLAVHSDNTRLTYEIARGFVNQNIRDIQKAQAANEDKLPSGQRSLKTVLLETLLDADRRRINLDENEESRPSSLTAYNFNNGKTPGLQIYHLPSEIVGFIRTASTSLYNEIWNLLVQRSWQRPVVKSGKKKDLNSSQEPKRNYLYEDIFTLPQGSRRFIRTYFLRIPERNDNMDDPRRDYSLRNESDLISWAFVELFLRKVMLMEKDRIEQIRTLGDGLAIYVQKQGGSGKRFFRAFFTEQSAANFRALLIKANIAHIKAGYDSLFDLDTYNDVFEEGYEVMRPDWRLARDLVLIRMVDQLKEWLSKNPDAAPDPVEEVETTTAAQ